MFRLHNYFKSGDRVYPNSLENYYSALTTKKPFGKYMLLGKCGGGFDYFETELVEINTDIVEGAFCAVYAARIDNTDLNYIWAALSPEKDGTNLVNRADIQIDGNVSEISCTVYLEYSASMLEFVGGVNALAGFLLGANAYALDVKMKAGNLYLPNKPFYRGDIAASEGTQVVTKFDGGILSYTSEFSGVEVRELLLLWDSKPVLRCFNTNFQSLVNLTVSAKKSKAAQVTRDHITDIFNVRDRNNIPLDFSMEKSQFTLEKREVLRFDMGANARFVGEPNSKYALIVNDKEVLVLTIDSDRPKLLGRIEKLSDEAHLTSNGSVVFKESEDVVIYEMKNGYGRNLAKRYALGKSDKFAVVYEPDVYQIGIVYGAEFKRYALSDGVSQIGTTLTVEPDKFHVCVHEAHTLAYGGRGQPKGCCTVDTEDSLVKASLEELFENNMPVWSQMNNTRAVVMDEYDNLFCYHCATLYGNCFDIVNEIQLMDKFFIVKNGAQVKIYTIDRGASDVNFMGEVPLKNITSAVWLGDYALFTEGDGICHSYYLWSKRFLITGRQFPAGNIYMSARQLSQTKNLYSKYIVEMKLSF